MKTVKRNKNDSLHQNIQFFLDKKIKLKNNYNFKVVQDYLREVYSGICCYCESRFEQGSSINIEHFYPKNYKNKKLKNIYSKYSNQLINLHYSCPKCNQLKNDRCPNGNLVFKKKSHKIEQKYKIGNDGFKIFSPNYIIYRISNHDERDFYLPKYKVEDNFGYITFNIFPIIDLVDIDRKDRAKGTIKIFDLNGTKKGGRFFLREERIRVFNKALKLSEQIKIILDKESIECGDLIKYFFQELSHMMDDSAPYSTMIKKQFGEIYVRFYEKYEQLKRARD